MTAENLKKSILQQAIQGKLLPQNPNDEPASALLERIRTEKTRLVAEGKIRRDKIESVIYRNANGRYMERIGKIEKDISDEIPFEIPESWEICRLTSLIWQITDGTHSTPKYTSSGVPFLSVKDMSSGKLNFENTKYISIEEHNTLTARCKPQKGDLLLSKVGSTGIPLIIDTDREFSIFVSLALIKFFPQFINSQYLLSLILSPFVQLQVQRDTRGVGNKNWVLKSIANTLMIIPPFAEQERIVAKIEELMPLVEEYDKAQSRLDELNSTLGDNLRKSVLQYAIQGKLLPQNPDDEPASALLDRIRAEKTRLVAEGKIKRDKNESVIFRNADDQYIERIGKTETDITDQIPFEIPDSWAWTKLENITYSVGNKNNQIQTKEILKKGAIPVVSQGQSLIAGYCEEFDKKIDNLPLVMFGDHTRNVKFIDFPFVIGADGTKFHKCILVYPKYIYYWMTIIADQLKNRGYARHYSLLKKEFIPLPPLAEQKRIVERTNQIFNKI